MHFFFVIYHKYIILFIFIQLTINWFSNSDWICNIEVWLMLKDCVCPLKYYKLPIWVWWLFGISQFPNQVFDCILMWELFLVAFSKDIVSGWCSMIWRCLIMVWLAFCCCFRLPRTPLSNQIRVVMFNVPQLTQASFLQNNQTLQNVFLISVTLRWHRASLACKNQSF